jgi:hypothetical protein
MRAFPRFALCTFAFGMVGASACAPTAPGDVVTAGIAVSNGQCQVSVTGSGQTVLVDDFILSRG